MRRLLVLLAAAAALAGPAVAQKTVAWPPATTNLAWPGAIGYGRFSIGAKNATQVCIIDRLTDDDVNGGGEGDCPGGVGAGCDATATYTRGDPRFCVEDTSGQGDNRYIVSEVCGWVDVCPGDVPGGSCQPLDASGDRVLLQLLTACGEGVGFRNGGGMSRQDGGSGPVLRLQDVDDWSIIGLRIDQGEPEAGEYASGDSLNISTTGTDEYGNHWIGFSEARHSTDEILAIAAGSANVTFQEVIVAEALQCTPFHVTNDPSDPDITNPDKWPHLTRDEHECPHLAGDMHGAQTDLPGPLPREQGWICEPGDPNEFAPCDKFEGGTPCVNTNACVRQTIQNHGRAFLISNSGASVCPKRISFRGIYKGSSRRAWQQSCNGDPARVNEIVDSVWYDQADGHIELKAPALRMNLIGATFLPGPSTRIGKLDYVTSGQGTELAAYGVLPITGYSELYVSDSLAVPPMKGPVESRRVLASPRSGACKVGSANCPAGGCACTLDDHATTCGTPGNPPFPDCEWTCPQFSETEPSYDLKGECHYLRSTPWPASGYVSMGRRTALEFQIAYAGVRTPGADAFTTRYVTEIDDCDKGAGCSSGAARPDRGVATVAELGGYPALTTSGRTHATWDNDADGICDVYEAAECGGGDCPINGTELAVADPNVPNYFPNAYYFAIGWHGLPHPTAPVAPWIDESDCI